MPRLSATGYAPLCDAGRTNVGKLKTAGVPVGDVHNPRVIHGFSGFQAAVDVSREAAREADPAAPVGIISSAFRVVQRCGCRHGASRWYRL